MALTQVSTKGLKDGTILNADINASASIAGTKINPDFGSQNIASTGQLQVTSQIPASFKRSVTGSSPVTVLIGNDTQTYALAASSTGFTINDYTNINVPRLGINSSGNVFIGGSSSVGTKLHIENASGDAHIRLRGSANYGILFTRHSDAALTGYVGSGNAVNLGGSNVALSAPLSGGDIIFQTNGTAATDEKMRIKSNGAISFTSQNATGWQLNAGDDSASYSAIDNHFPTTNRTLYFNAETTHRSVAFWNKNGSDGYGFGLDNSGNFKVVAGTTEHLKVTGSDGSALFGGDIRVDRGTAGIDGIVGQAYSGYFGLKHADQTLNSEYMMLSNNSHTFISCTSGYHIYIRPSANSQVHETVFAHDNTTYKTNIVMDGHPLRRNQHQWGHLEGSYNNIGANESKSNPIYTIGSAYNPNENDLNAASNGMYGIGFSTGNASFLPTGASWGLYGAAAGIANIFLDSGNGRLYFGSNITATPRFISAPTGDYGSIQINNGPTGGWRGYSIDGHSVFMSNGATAVTNYIGIYDDNASQWALLHARTAWVRLYYGGGLKFETTNAGVYIHGTLTATSTKSFRISHPLSELSETKDLVHAAIEGPQMDLMYRGKVDLVNGTATVNIDTKSGMTEGTFDVLNRDVQCFTTNETGWTNVKGSVTGNKLTIVAEDNSCTDTISWMVIGERKDNDVVSSEVTNDNGDLIVEPDKQIISEDPKMDD